jgi:hypothetical protein
MRGQVRSPPGGTNLDDPAHDEGRILALRPSSPSPLSPSDRYCFRRERPLNAGGRASLGTERGKVNDQRDLLDRSAIGDQVAVLADRKHRRRGPLSDLCTITCSTRWPFGNSVVIKTTTIASCQPRPFRRSRRSRRPSELATRLVGRRRCGGMREVSKMALLSASRPFHHLVAERTCRELPPPKCLSVRPQPGISSHPGEISPNTCPRGSDDRARHRIRAGQRPSGRASSGRLKI